MGVGKAAGVAGVGVIGRQDTIEVLRGQPCRCPRRVHLPLGLEGAAEREVRAACVYREFARTSLHVQHGERPARI